MTANLQISQFGKGAPRETIDRSRVAIQRWRYCPPTTHILCPFCSCDVPIVVGALRHEQLSPAAWRVRQLPGVVVVVVLVVVVCEPPAGIGIVSVVVEDDVVLGGVIGAAGVVVVLVVVDDDIGAGGVVCAIASGAASARPRASAPAVRSAFMNVSYWAASRPGG